MPVVNSSIAQREWSGARGKSNERERSGEQELREIGPSAERLFAR